MFQKENMASNQAQNPSRPTENNAKETEMVKDGEDDTTVSRTADS